MSGVFFQVDGRGTVMIQVIPTGVVFEVAAAGPHDEACAVSTSGAPLFTRGVASLMVHVQDGVLVVTRSAVFVPDLGVSEFCRK